MADANGTGADSLIRKLKEAPYSFNFFQAVRRLECRHRDKPRLGTSIHPRDDFVRFCQEPSLRFSPSTISAFKFDDTAPAGQMFLNFFGMLGPNGPLPAHITEYAMERILHHGDQTLARFLDIFNHRMASLFYRSWASSRKSVNYDRPDSDRFRLYIGSLLGIGMETLSNRDAIPDRAKLFYSGHLVCPHGHAEGLQSVLKTYFSLPVQIEEFVGQWINLPDDYYCRLGTSPDSSLLGQTAIAGARIWDCQNKFRIIMGPMAFEKYQRLLPGGEGYRRLKAWVRNYIGERFSWDVQLILYGREVPEIQLGQSGHLGQSAWLKSRPITGAIGDCILNPAVA